MKEHLTTRSWKEDGGLRREKSEPGSFEKWWEIFRKSEEDNCLPTERPWMEEPGRLQSMGSRRVGHN